MHGMKIHETTIAKRIFKATFEYKNNNTFEKKREYIRIEYKNEYKNNNNNTTYHFAAAVPPLP
jgi:hypothetical protein